MGELQVVAVDPADGSYHKTEFKCSDEAGRQVTICFVEELDVNDPDLYQYVKSMAEGRFETRSKTPVIGAWR